ncbi:MAG: hypothetical protein HYV75_03325 [Opitutae bacterium]|nr:hypothetical protein [Opitutae bacterium]
MTGTTTRVVVARAAVEVVVREQQLCDGEALPRERAGVGVHELRLADGGAGLPGGEFLRARGQTERGQARGDRAA